MSLEQIKMDLEKDIVKNKSKLEKSYILNKKRWITI